MAILPIYNCFNPIMREKAIKIENINDEIVRLSNDLMETMKNADGIGLAANQVGSNLSILAIDEFALENDKSGYLPEIMINPIITSFSEEIATKQEGCLSIPKFYEDVDRPAFIEVQFYDINMKEIKIEASKLLARVIQHEIDHLNGKLFIDRISPLRRALAKSKLKKIQRGTVEAEYDMIDPTGNFFKGLPKEES